MIFKSLRTISTRALTFGSCVLQQSDVGMSIELLAIQLLLFKTRCNANSSSNNLGRFALKISNCHLTIGIKYQLCTFCLQHCITTQFSAYPIFVHKITRVILPLLQKCTYFTCFNANSYPCRFWYKPLSPHTTLPSTLTAPESWTVARAWIMLGRTLPTRTCSPKAKLAVCQGCSFYNGTVISPSESSHLKLQSF